MGRDIANVKISVIVPVYNAAKYVRNCTESVLNSTHKNIELILVNDGSTDDSLQVLESIKASDPRVVIIDKKNAGVSAARNDGIKASTGEFIHFIDSDDWIDNNCYENMLKAMVKDVPGEDADVGYFGWSKDNIYKTAFVQSKEGYTGEGGQDKILELMLSLVGAGGGYVSYGNYVWNKIYKKASLYNENGELVLFDENVSIAEDGLWLANAAKNWNKGVFDKTPYYHYFQNPDSVMNNAEKYKKTRLGSEESHVKMIKIIEEYAPSMAELHRDVCNKFFLSHMEGDKTHDPSFIKAVLDNLITINKGTCPFSVAERIAELLGNKPKDTEFLNRKLVKKAIAVTKRLDKRRKGTK
ncbi:MAG: glycosyltransferase family 2 protein [Lachnospiraceae bacterium]|nr:glycosyltransferase family 2 protein [Lachnospiraceae bacterium]